MSKLTDGAVLKVQWGHRLFVSGRRESYEIFGRSYYLAQKELGLPQRRLNIWRRKYQNPLQLKIGTLISAVFSFQVRFCFFFLFLVLSQNNRSLLWEPCEAGIWQGSYLETTCIHGLQTNMHTLLCYGELAEPLKRCNLIHHSLLFIHQILFGWLHARQFFFLFLAVQVKR